jgi:hypothetical protein
MMRKTFIFNHGLTRAEKIIDLDLGGNKKSVTEK